MILPGYFKADDFQIVATRLNFFFFFSELYIHISNDLFIVLSQW